MTRRQAARRADDARLQFDHAPKVLTRTGWLASVPPSASRGMPAPDPFADDRFRLRRRRPMPHSRPCRGGERSMARSGGQPSFADVRDRFRRSRCFRRRPQPKERDQISLGERVQRFANRDRLLSIAFLGNEWDFVRAGFVLKIADQRRRFTYKHRIDEARDLTHLQIPLCCAAQGQKVPQRSRIGCHDNLCSC